MNSPDVSIVIPVFNRSEFTPRAIRSCLEQSVRVEVLVVDDGSFEDVEAELRQYSLFEMESRLRFFRQENQGACVARNLGLAHATGRYVKFLDSDDELMPDALAKEVDAADESGAEVVVTGWETRRFRKNEKDPIECLGTASAPDLRGSRGDAA